jgi:hypothetical protein
MEQGGAMKQSGIMVCVLGLCAGAVLAEEPAVPQSEAKLRIGVYDSRAIAVAFVGSPVYKATNGKKLTEMMAEHEKAKAEGNQKRIAELEAWGKAQQALLHKQGFSTAPVDNILQQVDDRLPAIKQKADVTVLVSKWDKETLAKHPSAELIDVTMDLVDAFNPNERQRKSAVEIQKHQPISLEEADKIDD